MTASGRGQRTCRGSVPEKEGPAAVATRPVPGEDGYQRVGEGPRSQARTRLSRRSQGWLLGGGFGYRRLGRLLVLHPGFASFPLVPPPLGLSPDTPKQRAPHSPVAPAVSAPPHAASILAPILAALEVPGSDLALLLLLHPSFHVRLCRLSTVAFDFFSADTEKWISHADPVPVDVG